MQGTDDGGVVVAGQLHRVYEHRLPAVYVHHPARLPLHHRGTLARALLGAVGGRVD